jgi:hypothetical protein
MTQLLQGLHGYCSGNKRLFELSESFRNNVVHHAKCVGLFNHRPNVRPSALSEMPPEERWKDWIRQEQRNRLGWAVYVSLSATLVKQHLLTRLRLEVRCFGLVSP